MLKSKKSKALLFPLKKAQTQPSSFHLEIKFLLYKNKFSLVHAQFEWMSLDVISTESYTHVGSSVAGFLCNINVKKF